MALLSSCRRGALHQRLYLHGFLAENHAFTSGYLGGCGRGEHQDAKYKEKQLGLEPNADKGSAPEEGGGRSWMRPFVDVFYAVDRQLDYFRPAYGQTAPVTVDQPGGKGKVVRSGDREPERGTLGGDEGAHASTSFGGDLGLRTLRKPSEKKRLDALVESEGTTNSGMRNGLQKGAKTDVVPPESSSTSISRARFRADGNTVGNGFAASGSQRLPAEVRKILGEASKEAGVRNAVEEASRELKPMKYTGRRDGKFVNLSLDDGEKELHFKLARRLLVKGSEGGQAHGFEAQGGSARAGQRGNTEVVQRASGKTGHDSSVETFQTVSKKPGQGVSEKSSPGVSLESEQGFSANAGQGVSVKASPGVSKKSVREEVGELGPGVSGERTELQPKGKSRRGKKIGLDGSSAKKVVEEQSAPAEPVAKKKRGRKKGSEKEGASGAAQSLKEETIAVSEPAPKRRKSQLKAQKEGRSPVSDASLTSRVEALGSARESSKPEEASAVVSEDGLVRVAATAPEARGEKKRKRGQKDVSQKKSQLPPLPDARALYTQMLGKEKEEHARPALTPGKDGGKGNAEAILSRFIERGWASDQALALYVNHELFPVVADRFRKLVLHGCTDELGRWLRTAAPSDEAEEALFPLFAELCLQEFRDELRHFRKLVESANLTEPQKWYPYARAMKRKIIYHCGPTNSGKTYEALQRLKQAENGLYCGPLRLLAMEIFDTLNADGVYCNLTTGQERRTVPFANHTSCTVEMAHLGNEYEVAVIDEIQMMADDHRGWAWTRALLGLQAKEIHVCGDSSVLKMLKNIAKTCGDELEVRNYKRWKPLSVEEESLGGRWERVGEGDCVVAFSRKEIFQIKDEIEARGTHKCCLIYGALPPETRRQQARLFNDPDSGYNVLVASDAIGMGLNLNIRRMVFAKMEKFSGGTGRVPIPTPMVKQIAGRAGRRNSAHPEGLANTFLPEDLPKLRAAMAAPMEAAEKGGLFPIFEQMELFAGQLPDVRFPELLDKFAETSLLDSSYFLCKHDQIRTIANLLEKVPTLRLRDRFSLCQAPINTRSLEGMSRLLLFAKAYAEGTPVPLKVTFRDAADISELEWKHQVVSAYLWLSYQLEETQFPHRAEAEQLLSSMVSRIDQRLAGSIRLPARGKRTGSKHRLLANLVGDALFERQKLRDEEKESEGSSVAAVL